MNPYLEQNDTWEDFHTNFLTRAQEALAGQVGPNYLVKIEVRLLLHELSADERRYLGKADVGVSEMATSRGAPPALAAAGAPVFLQLPAVEVERHISLEIRDRRNRRVVTVLELLSPSNKAPGEDRDDYLAKRRQVLAGPTHLVEIDLRRGGSRPTPPQIPACDYYALVSQHEDRPKLGFWPISLRESLPSLPVPLSAPDPPVKLDLKVVLDRAYDGANYGKYIYEEDPEPPLSAEDQAWALGFIPRREAGS
ncbi:hypothetical protein AYO40_04510 [Planctomycetaceae bacterium SCGC AG-212-D15]|nr:hypothetical protein AYO40_04510 [Planctomycetaceae bacterium SCGC AG-212-D15]